MAVLLPTSDGSSTLNNDDEPRWDVRESPRGTRLGVLSKAFECEDDAPLDRLATVVGTCRVGVWGCGRGRVRERLVAWAVAWAGE